MLVKWQPFGSLVERDIFDDFMPTRAARFEPRIDVKETDKSFVIEAELPGLNKDDFKLTIEDNILTLEGEKKHEHEQKNGGLYRSERSYGKFRRSFRLTDEVDRSKVNAEYKDGILTIDVPKSPKAQPKQIDVKMS